MIVSSRFVLSILISFALVPVAGARAQEGAKACGQAVGGTVKPTDGFCDIYQRQIEYKKNAEEFRKSLDERRVSFEKPREESLQRYREDLDKIYKEESEKYQAELAVVEEAKIYEEDETNYMAPDDTSGDGMPEDGQDEAATPEDPDAAQGADVSEAGGDEPADGESGSSGVIEKTIESAPDSGDKPVTRIIMPEDAPPF